MCLVVAAVIAGAYARARLWTRSPRWFSAGKAGRSLLMQAALAGMSEAACAGQEAWRCRVVRAWPIGFCAGQAVSGAFAARRGICRAKQALNAARCQPGPFVRSAAAAVVLFANSRVRPAGAGSGALWPFARCSWQHARAAPLCHAGRNRVALALTDASRLNIAEERSRTALGPRAVRVAPDGAAVR